MSGSKRTLAEDYVVSLLQNLIYRVDAGDYMAIKIGGSDLDTITIALEKGGSKVVFYVADAIFYDTDQAKGDSNEK